MNGTIMLEITPYGLRKPSALNLVYFTDTHI
jgi:hypothetical protein